jgi:hypothetical protein
VQELASLAETYRLSNTLFSLKVWLRNMDYFMLGVFELHVNKAHHNTIASLVVTIKEVMDNLDKDTMTKACRCFRTRIEAVVEANRDLFNRMVHNAYDFHIFLFQ